MRTLHYSPICVSEICNENSSLQPSLHICSFNSLHICSFDRNGSGDATDGLVMRSIESLFEKIRTLQREGLQFKVCSLCL